MAHEEKVICKKQSVIISVSLFFLGQAVAGIWWASKMNEKMQSVNNAIALQQNEKYTRAAAADFAVRDVKICNNTEKIQLFYATYKTDIQEIKSVINKLDDKVDTLLTK